MIGKKQQHISTLKAQGVNYNSQMHQMRQNLQIKAQNDQYNDHLQQQYNQMQNMINQHYNQAINTYETNQKTMDNSPTKIQYNQDSKMGVTSKKKTKVIRKSVRNKESTNLNQDQNSIQNQITKSLDRVSGLQYQPQNQNQIQINVDHGLNPNQVQESKIFANNVMKFQSTSTKSNGAKKIKVSGQDIAPGDIKLIKQKAHLAITNNNSLLNMQKMNMAQLDTGSAQQNVGQHQDFLNQINKSMQGHKKNHLSSNFGSGTNLKTLQNSKIAGHQQYMTSTNNQVSNATQQKRKGSIGNFKNIGIDPHPQINTQELISNTQGLMMNQSKTTKNSNYYPIDSGSLTIQMKNSTGVSKINGSTTNQAMVSSMRMKNPKIQSIQKQEFNCLINNMGQKTADLDDEPNFLPQKTAQGSRLVSAGHSKSKQNHFYMVESQSYNPSNTHTNYAVNSQNISQIRMRQDCNTHGQNSIQNSVENLNNQQNNQDFIKYQNFDMNTKSISSFNNTQGVNIQQIMLESEGTFSSEHGYNKQLPTNSSKRLNQTTNFNQTQMKQHNEIINKQIDGGKQGGVNLMTNKNMIGPYIIQNNKQLAQQVVQGVPSMKFYNQVGSSSATNKAKKAFNFELDPNQKSQKMGKTKGQSQVANQKQKIPINIKQNQQNISQPNTAQQTKKMLMQNKQKLKTQMNLTGPIPKNILSPKTMANKSQGKSKHSQYFNNEQEIVMQNFMLPQKLNNAPQNFNIGQITPQNNHGDLQIFYQNSNINNNPINQHQHQQYSVNLNGVHQHQHERSTTNNNQPQITTSTQGCNTVININIDSNTFRRLHNDTNKKTESNTSALNQHHVSSIKHQNQNSAGNKQNKQTRQTSSKMKRNDSISSNKSKKVGQNRRSNSGSQMRNNQVQTYSNISQLTNLNNYNQPAPAAFLKNQSPKSNTDIIMNNIAMINQKLNQQEAVNYSGNGQNLQININRVNENQLGSTLKKNLKTKQKKETPLLDQKKGNPQMFSLNTHLFNQTQKLMVQGNPQTMNPIQTDKPTIYSIIPKKQNDQDQTTGFKYKNNTQKLTLKKISKNKKSDNTNSMIDSARTPAKSAGNNQMIMHQIAGSHPQSQFYNNQNNIKQDELYDQLLSMENVIQQNQIKLRNELIQMQNSMNKKTKNQSLDKVCRSQIMHQENIDDFSTLNNQFDLDHTEEGNSKNYQFAPQINMLHMEQSRTHGQSSQIKQREYQTQIIPGNAQQNQNKTNIINAITQKQGSGLTMIKMPANQPRPNRSTGNSVQGRQIKNPKLNIEDINIEVDGMSQFSQNLMFQDQNQALNYISTKKSVSTKNQFNQQKIQTQNVQNLLREAKREMIVESNSNDNNGDIFVGGDDLSNNKQSQKKPSRFFNGTQNLKISNQPYNFNVIQAPKGFTPQNNQQQISDFEIKDFHSQGTAGSSSTFGLGQINKKKQIIKQSNQEQNYNNQINNNKQQISKSAPGKSVIGAASKNLSIHTSANKQMQISQNPARNTSKNINMGPEGITAPFQQKQMKQSVQFPKKNVEYSIPNDIDQKNNDNNQSITNTLPSQVSDYGPYGGGTQEQKVRNSNLPPAGSQVNMESEVENLLIDSKISEIEQNETNTNPPSALLDQNEESDFQNQQIEIQPVIEKKQDEELPLPISGAKVLKHYLKRPGMTEYEKSEVLDFKQVFFLGLGAEKINGSKFNQFNFGYDDERGDYNVVLKDHLAFRFEVIDFLGKGSFGQALKCYDHKTQEIVAVKIIRNKKKFQHQAGVELKILLHLRDNDPDDTNNIIRIKDYCNFRKHLIISFELFSINLYEFIKNNNFEGVSLSLIRRFAIQILQALKYLREENLIHCDLKPENILLKSPDKSGIKVIDFGSSCFSNERIYTYIQSRFYRAPEIILGIPYTAAIDMWSFGCILTELFTGIPIFPGESEQEQLSMIIQVLGLPDERTLEHASRKNIFFDEETKQPNLTQNSQGELRLPLSKPLEQVLMCQSDSFLDFIRKCLEWNPEKRISPFDALMHEWIIEGLPPQVLVHHKKMLGIYESETEEEDVLNEHSQLQAADSLINDSSQQQIQMDTSQYDQMNELIDKQDLSCSIMQGFDDVEISNDMENKNFNN